MQLRRFSLVLSVIVVILTAGLATPAHAAPATARAQSEDGFTFTKPVALNSFAPLRTAVGSAYSISRRGNPSDHEWSGEPVIEVDAKGRIYIAGTCCVVAASPVWYSKDGGKTFEEMTSAGHVREWTIGAEGDLEVDDEGRIYFVDTYVPGLLMTRWSEYGDKWDFTVPPAGPVPGFDDRPWLAWSEKALYLYVNHVSHTQVYRSTDGGITWLTEGPLEWNGSPLGQPYFPGHIAADRKTGTLWVTGVVSHDGKEVLGSAVSSDGGKTFTEALVSPPQRKGGFSPIFTGATAVDDAGNGYTTWSTWDNNGCAVYYAASSNEGKSWGAPIKVNRSSQGCATFPWIEAEGDGKVAVSWYETPATKRADAGERFVRALTNGQTIYGGIKLPLAAYQDELPEDARWYLEVAAVRDAASARPKVIGTRVPTKTPVLLGPMGRQLWDFLQVDIDDSGRIHVTYAEKYKDSAPQTWYVATKNAPLK